MSIIEEIAAERRRQREKEKYSLIHDDEHRDGSLARAAACYAQAEFMDLRSSTGHYHVPNVRAHGSIWWPWGWQWWKPKSHRENLIRAAALIVAEIERLDRAAIRAVGVEPQDNRGGEGR